MPASPFKSPSRRTVLKGAVAASLGLAAPATLRAQPVFVRKNLISDEAKRDVDSYRRAIAKMLSLEPDHPHNWYRNAVIHLMDCPHGNWWFTVWHRGYLGYFERIIRKLSGDPEFALPYWDWTKQPLVTPAFFSDPGSSDPSLKQNALDPSSDHFVDGFAPFGTDYKDAFRKMFDSFTPAQVNQLSLRLSTQTEKPGQIMDFDTFWDGWDNSVEANFVWTRATSRGKTPAMPDLTDSAAKDVRKSVILSAIRPQQFVLVPAQPGQPARAGFNSVVLANHHGMSRSQATLELQPHNQVHNNLGTGKGPLWGIMPSNLSSVDPLFFMHHSNVDRIWDVWTRKQQNKGLPIGPQSQEDLYYNEEFLFFLDDNGDPVSADTKAKTFMHTNRFGYSYTPGTGEELVGLPLVAANINTGDNSVVANAMFSTSASGTAGLSLPKEFAETITDPANAANHVANITFVPPEQVFGVTFNVFVSPKGVAPTISKDSPDLASSFQFFGMLGKGSMAGKGEPVTVTVDVTDALNRLEDQGIIKADAELDFTVMAVNDAEGSEKSVRPIEGELKSVHIEAI